VRFLSKEKLKKSGKRKIMKKKNKINRAKNGNTVVQFLHDWSGSNIQNTVLRFHLARTGPAQSSVINILHFYKICISIFSFFPPLLEITLSDCAASFVTFRAIKGSFYILYNSNGKKYNHFYKYKIFPGASTIFKKYRCY
jgi:hypothetical protein